MSVCFVNVFRRRDRFFLVSQKEINATALHFTSLISGQFTLKRFINISLSFSSIWRQRPKQCVICKRLKVKPWERFVAAISDWPVRAALFLQSGDPGAAAGQRCGRCVPGQGMGTGAQSHISCRRVDAQLAFLRARCSPCQAGRLGVRLLGAPIPHAHLVVGHCCCLFCTSETSLHGRLAGRVFSGAWGSYKVGSTGWGTEELSPLLSAGVWKGFWMYLGYLLIKRLENGSREALLS